MKIVLKFICLFIAIMPNFNSSGSLWDQIKNFTGFGKKAPPISDLYSLNISLNNLGTHISKLPIKAVVINNLEAQKAMLPKVRESIEALFNKQNIKFLNDTADTVAFEEKLDDDVKEELKKLIKSIDELIASVNLIEDFKLNIKFKNAGEKIIINNKADLLKMLDGLRKYTK